MVTVQQNGLVLPFVKEYTSTYMCSCSSIKHVRKYKLFRGYAIKFPYIDFIDDKFKILLKQY